MGVVVQDVIEQGSLTTAKEALRRVIILAFVRRDFTNATFSRVTPKRDLPVRTVTGILLAILRFVIVDCSEINFMAMRCKDITQIRVV